jgi:hypothetical protein
MPSIETDTLIGVITSWRASDAPRPSKLRMDLGEEEVELTVWPTDKGQEALRQYLTTIDPDDLVDERVVATVNLPGSEYQGTKQYKVVKLKPIGAEPKAGPTKAQVKTPPPTPAAPAPTVSVPSIDGPRWGQNLNIAVTLRTTYPDLSDDELFDKATSLAVKFYSQTPGELWQMVLAERASKVEAAEDVPDDGFGVINLDADEGVRDA